LRTAPRSLFSPTLGADPHEPVLAWSLRSLPWLTRGRAARHGVLVFVGGGLASAALLLATGGSGMAVSLALLLPVALRLVLDELTMVRAWGRIGLEYRTGRWDALRLTGVWRLMMAVLGVQTGVVVSLLVFTLREPAASGSPIVPLFTLTTAGVILVLDVLMRTRALAALGLALSASAPRAGAAAVLGSLALILFWFAQMVAILTGLMLASFVAAFASLLIFDSFDWSTLALLALVLPLAVDVLVQRSALYRLALAVAERDGTA
jgi:hypothetical protein